MVSAYSALCDVQADALPKEWQAKSHAYGAAATKFDNFFIEQAQAYNKECRVFQDGLNQRNYEFNINNKRPVSQVGVDQVGEMQAFSKQGSSIGSRVKSDRKSEILSNGRQNLVVRTANSSSNLSIGGK